MSCPDCHSHETKTYQASLICADCKLVLKTMDGSIVNGEAAHRGIPLSFFERIVGFTKEDWEKVVRGKKSDKERLEVGIKAAKKIIELWEDCWILPINWEQVAENQIHNLTKKRQEVRGAIDKLREFVANK